MAESFQKKVVFPPAGSYILAVSGGVDSVTLLDVFAKAAKQKEYALMVAHFDHGIRADSASDCKFVAELAKHYGLAFSSKQGRLGPKASEAAARKARYAFLSLVAKKHRAQVVTAQHTDDYIETSIFNIGRKSAAKPFANKHVLRPFINIYRKDILAYAKKHRLNWREDPTNTDLTNPRNFIRHVLIPHLEKQQPQFKKTWLKQH